MELKRSSHSAVIPILAALAGGLLGLHLQTATTRILDDRLASDFHLLASQRAELIKGSLIAPLDNLMDLGHLFENSDQVVDREFQGFISGWKFSCAGTSFATYRDGQYARPDLGTLPDSLLPAIETILTTAPSGTAIQAFFIPNSGAHTTWLILEGAFNAPRGKLVRVVATEALQECIEADILGTEEFGLPTTLRERGKRAILYFHEPRLDARMGRPLLQPEEKPRLSLVKDLKLADRELEIRVDASPGFIIRHANHLPKLIPPALALIAALIAFTLTYLIQKKDLAIIERREAINLLKRFFDLDLGLLCILDLSGCFIRVSSGWQKLLGYSEEELIGHLITEFIHPDDRVATESVFSNHRKGIPDNCSVNRYRKKDGSWLMIEWRGTSTDQFIYGVGHDVSEREAYEAQLCSMLAEKATLLKEVHHRVKNNLQIISSMLSLQDSEPDTNQFSQAIAAAQGRIRTMALVHETLYQGDSISGVDFQDYTRSLASLFSISEKGQVIDLRMNCDPLILSLDLAIHCGLLVNELATNAVKYAFASVEQAILKIALRENDGALLLSVEDNGPGIRQGFDPILDSHLGLKLAESLAAQIGGNACHLQILNSEELGGARFLVEFTPAQGAWWRSPIGQ